MKKVEKCIEEKTHHRIVMTIGDVAIVEDEEKNRGLLSLRSGIYILPLENNVITVDENNHLIFSVMQSQNIPLHPELTIFDYEKNELLCYNAEVINTIEKDATYILKPSSDNSYVLFDKVQYIKERRFRFVRRSDGTLVKLHSGLVPVHREKNHIFLVLEDGQHKCLYEIGRGFIEPSDCDEITIHQNAILLSKDGKTVAVGSSYRTDEFDRITVDSSNPNILYCKDGNTTYVYAIYGNDYKRELVAIMQTDADYLEFVDKTPWPRDYRGMYRFITSKKSKYSLVERYVSDIETFGAGTNITKGEFYDAIWVSAEKIYLGKDEKLKVRIQDEESEYYDDIAVVDDRYFIYFKCDSIDVALCQNPSKLLAKDAKSYRKTIHGIIVEGAEEETLVTCAQDGKFYTVSGHHIKHLYDDYFAIEREGLQALYQRGKFLSDFDNIEITLRPDDVVRNNLFDTGLVYVALRKSVADYRMMTIRHNGSKPAMVMMNHPAPCTEITFFLDFFVIRTRERMSLITYHGISHNFSPDTDVKISGYCGNTMKEKAIYSIDGKDYIAYLPSPNSPIELVEVDTSIRKIHMAAYETRYGTIVINSQDEDQFACTCNTIDAISEKEIGDILREYALAHPKIEENYPHLTLKHQK